MVRPEPPPSPGRVHGAHEIHRPRPGQIREEHPQVTFPRPAAVVVLAAGEGTRMRSATPKVLHTLAGR